MTAVSWFKSEFLTLRRLIFNILFYGSHFGLFAYGWYSQETNKRLDGLNSLKYSVWISRGAGLALAYDGGLIMLPMLRNIIRALRPKFTWLMAMDENIWFHRQVAYSMAGWTVVHITAHYVNFINVERTQLRRELAVQIHYNQAGGITGHFMTLIMVVMYSTASAKIRKQCFEAFWYTHHLAFFFMIGLYTHATGCFVRDSPDPDYISSFPFYSTKHCLGYESWRFIIWPAVLYVGERIWREVRGRKATTLEKVLVHPSGAIELRMIKPGFKFTPGQWVFVQIPVVSGFQWHPFSISSAPEDPYISVTICPVGDWTEEVGEVLGAGPAVVAALASATQTAEAEAEVVYNIARSSEDDKPKRPPRPYSYIDETLDQSDDTIVHHMPPPPGLAQSQNRDSGPLLTGGGVRPSDQFYEVVPSGARSRLSSASATSNNPNRLPAVRIDGPYGAPSEDVFRSDLAVLVGAGIGVTPFASILKHIWYRQRAGRLGRLRHVEFIWVCRDAKSFAWFSSVLREIEDAQIDPNFLRISMYITQRLSIDQLYNIAINDTAGTEYDPLTRLRSRTFYGRPDFNAIYTRLRSAVENDAFVGARETRTSINIGTFFCGPGALARVVKQNALACSTPTANFTFAKEHF